MTILESQSSRTSIGQVHWSRSAIEVGRLFADPGQRIKTLQLLDWLLAWGFMRCQMVVMPRE